MSDLDFTRFGVRTAKAFQIGIDSVKEIDAFCQQHRAELCIARCSTENIGVVHELENRGFRVMDTLVYYGLQLRKATFDLALPETIRIRESTINEADEIKAIAARSFTAYRGHYFSDERIPKDKSDEVYVDWAYRSAKEIGSTKAVLVADVAGVLSGFATLAMNSAQEGEGILFAVDPSAQGQGIYRYFMIHAAQWCRDKGAQRMIVSTQIDNVMVQKVWAKLGFTVSHSTYTLHRWAAARSGTYP